MLCGMGNRQGPTVEVPRPPQARPWRTSRRRGARTVGVDALLATRPKGNGAEYPARRRQPARPRATERAAAQKGSNVMVPTWAKASPGPPSLPRCSRSRRPGVTPRRDALRSGNGKGLGRRCPRFASGTLSEVMQRRRHRGKANGKLARDLGRCRKAPSRRPIPAARTKPPRQRRPPPRDARKGRGRTWANAPSAEKLMAEKGLEAAAQVTGTGRDGRIMK